MLLCGEGVGSRCCGKGSAHRVVVFVLVFGGVGVGSRCFGSGTAHRLLSLVFCVCASGVCGCGLSVGVLSSGDCSVGVLGGGCVGVCGNGVRVGDSCGDDIGVRVGDCGGGGCGLGEGVSWKYFAVVSLCGGSIVVRGDGSCRLLSS